MTIKLSELFEQGLFLAISLKQQEQWRHFHSKDESNQKILKNVATLRWISINSTFNLLPLALEIWHRMDLSDLMQKLKLK